MKSQENLSQQNNIEKQNIYFQFQNNYYKKETIKL